MDSRTGASNIQCECGMHFSTRKQRSAKKQNKTERNTDDLKVCQRAWKPLKNYPVSTTETI